MPEKQFRSEEVNTITMSFSVRPDVCRYIKEYAKRKNYTKSKALCEIVRRFKDNDK